MSKWLVVAFISMLSMGSIAQEQFVEGQHYQVIKTPVRTADPSRIEVTEVFCNGLPYLIMFRPYFEQ